MSDRVVKTFDYRTPDGHPAFQVAVLESGEIKPRRQNPTFNPAVMECDENQRWLWSLDGAKRYIYRADEVRKAIAANPKRMVWIVGTEAAADALWEMGLVGTTHPGSGKWLVEYSEYLRSCFCTVIPDEDVPDPKTGLARGLEAARQTVASLTGRAAQPAQAQVVRLPGAGERKVDLLGWLNGLGKPKEEWRAAFITMVEAQRAAAAPAPAAPPAAAPPAQQPTQPPPGAAPAPVQASAPANGAAGPLEAVLAQVRSLVQEAQPADAFELGATIWGQVAFAGRGRGQDRLVAALKIAAAAVQLAVLSGGLGKAV